MMFLLTVTLTSMLLAAIMSAIAWRIAGDERRRSEARVAALSAEIHDAAPKPVATVSANFFTARQAPSGARPFAVLAGGALVFSAAVAMAILVGGRFSRAPRSANAAAVVGVAATAPPLLELVALGHERDGDRLTVRGVVRNPPSGAGMDRLTAVVLLFTSDGGFLASGRAVVESPALRPGAESTFVVSVAGAGDVGRYRVSFRTDDRIVPHLDRRHEQS
jgi:hypothetical protein